MRDVILTRDLTGQGLTTDEVTQLERRGDLVRLRRGVYTSVAGTDLNDADEYERAATRHRQLVEGTMRQLHPRAVISHGSAAVLHGLPLFTNAIERVHVTRDRRGGGARRSSVQVHGSTLTSGDLTVIEGLPVTSLARTVADLARTLPYEQAVAVGDRALASGLELGDLAAALELAAHWAGASQARRVAAFIDERSESVGESFSRVGFQRDGLPPPEPQYTVYNDSGIFVGRSDFGWPEMRTLGEFDGKQKYLRLRREGETLEEFLIREKLREDALRDLGWQVVRWVWAELFQRQVIADRLRRAFARGQQ